MPNLFKKFNISKPAKSKKVMNFMRESGKSNSWTYCVIKVQHMDLLLSVTVNIGMCWSYLVLNSSSSNYHMFLKETF